MIRRILILIFSFEAIIFSAQSQNKVITGRILNENLKPIHAVVSSEDSKYYVATDTSGYFTITLPDNIYKIVLESAGMRYEEIELEAKCFLNFIMIKEETIEFYTDSSFNRYINRKNRKRKSLIKKAYRKGLFEQRPCS